MARLLSRRYGALVVMCVLLASSMLPMSIFEQNAHAAPARRQLFILVQGLGSMLTSKEAADGTILNRPESFGEPTGIYSALKKQFQVQNF
jgi:hypothetical protein